MEKLNFYLVDPKYVSYLQEAETRKRGFSRVPSVDYSPNERQKFFCGVVLKVNSVDYFVPVSSYKLKKPDNFLIQAQNGKVVGSLRFNYMFPVPLNLAGIRMIDEEPDRAYRSLLSQELRYCLKHQDTIHHLAERTYRRVIQGKNPGLVANSCDFPLLEQKCLEYSQDLAKHAAEKPSVRARLSQLRSETLEERSRPERNERDSR